MERGHLETLAERGKPPTGNSARLSSVPMPVIIPGNGMQSVQVRVMSRGWLYGLTAALCILILGGALFLNFRQATGPDPRIVAGADAVDFCRDVQALFRDNRFDELERMGRNLAGLKERVTGGEEKVGLFYRYLAVDGCTTSFCEARPVQPENIRKIQDWLNRMPKSAVAKTAMSTNWYYYAWMARTCDEFADVTFDNWQRFYDRLRISGAYLSGLDLRENPAAYIIMLDILRQTGGPREKLDAVYEEAHSAFPSLFMLNFVYARALDTGWFGRKGDLEWLAESQLHDPGGDIGLVSYSFIAQEAAELAYNADYFTTTGLSWAKIKEGYAVRKRLYGLSVHDWNVYGWIAFMASDREAAREAYDNFAPNWDPTVWQDRNLYFQRMLPWINER
jgi:hypothetical protein